MFVKRRRFGPEVSLLRTRAMATLLAVAVLLGSGERAAQAQGKGNSPGIEIPAEIIVTPAVVTPLPIKISRTETLTSQAMLMVRGLPPRVTLSEGRSFSSGVWAVPLSSVGKIELAPAQGTGGRADLNIQLVTLDGAVLAEAKSTLFIVPPELTQQTSPARKGESTVMTVAPLPGRSQVSEQPLREPASLGKARGLTQDELENARKLVQKGDGNMQEGKIAAARLFYRSAAENGYAPAALALGATFDARQLARSKVAGGIQPDPAEARKWYEKARELGSAEAERRLQDLATR
jgi:hypothetical protein